MRNRTGRTSRKETSAPLLPKAIFGPARSTFMWILQLRENKNGSSTCSCGVLIPKKDRAMVGKVTNGIQAAVKKKFGPNVDIFKSTRIRNPLQDGDELYDDPDTSVGKEAKGHYILSCKMYRLPVVVDQDVQPIMDPEEKKEICVSGYYFNYSIVFKGYEFEEDGVKSKGVRAEIINIQYVKKGPRLDASSDPEDDFQAIEREDGDDYEVDDEYEEEPPKKKRRGTKSGSSRSTSRSRSRRQPDYDDEDDYDDEAY